MTTPTIKADIKNALELADQLRMAMMKINSSACEEIRQKEKAGLTGTEEMLISSFVLPEISTATDLYGKLASLHNVYDR